MGTVQYMSVVDSDVCKNGRLVVNFFFLLILKFVTL